jgi:hypothetical protein
MTQELPKTTICLALTGCQKRQIREATGREVNTLELRLAPLSPPAGPAEHAERPSGSAEPCDPINPRRKP